MIIWGNHMTAKANLLIPSQPSISAISVSIFSIFYYLVFSSSFSASIAGWPSFYIGWNNTNYLWYQYYNREVSARISLFLHLCHFDVVLGLLNRFIIGMYWKEVFMSQKDLFFIWLEEQVSLGFYCQLWSQGEIRECLQWKSTKMLGNSDYAL